MTILVIILIILLVIPLTSVIAVILTTVYLTNKNCNQIQNGEPFPPKVLYPLYFRLLLDFQADLFLVPNFLAVLAIVTLTTIAKTGAGG